VSIQLHIANQSSLADYPKLPGLDVYQRTPKVHIFICYIT